MEENPGATRVEQLAERVVVAKAAVDVVLDGRKLGRRNVDVRSDERLRMEQVQLVEQRARGQHGGYVDRREIVVNGRRSHMSEQRLELDQLVRLEALAAGGMQRHARLAGGGRADRGNAVVEAVFAMRV